MNVASCGAAGLILSLVAASLGSAEPIYFTPEAAKADPDYALQGEYVGQGLGVQVVALGDAQFSVVTYRGGLPGAGWDGKEKQTGEYDRQEVSDLVGEWKKVERTSPTMGAAPPAGGIALFDGPHEPLARHWKGGAKLEDGLLLPGCTSLDTFADFTVHLEFRLPFMPRARGQDRGNSGVYHQGRYETQVLDSFGLEGKDNECGGIDSVQAPTVNMCLPPLAWQTYDVDFTAARWDDQGKKIANARLTVRLNGVVVQQGVEVPQATTAAPWMEGPQPGPIYLEDHGSPVRYRNVWVLPRDVEREARRPIVPGFERFFAAAGADRVAGGRLLLGELNCTACHRAEAGLLPHIVKRQPPILDGIAGRVLPEYAVSFIADPHGTKPGTTMPDLFAGKSPAERQAAARALASFLFGSGRPREQAGNRQYAKHGEQLFHHVGCVACHEPRNGGSVAAGSVPLGDLKAKYTIASLVEFLKNPHLARPARRMPGFNLNNDEARDLACYLASSERKGDEFVVDQSLAEQGRELFASLGCAACHQFTVGGQVVQPKLVAKALKECDAAKGCVALQLTVGEREAEDGLPRPSSKKQDGLARPCSENVLAASPQVASPDFGLTTVQQEALAAAIEAPEPTAAPGVGEQVANTMAAFNCYACHARDGRGGPTADRNPLFVTTIPEMGDEGRVPPPLDGVGDKLEESWLRHVLEQGAKDRPYMLTRMPKFGAAEVVRLGEAFKQADQRTEIVTPQLAGPVSRIKSTGRFLVGDKALACVKCHTFGEHRATGIQAINLQPMTSRIRYDWFQRYLPDPPKYRPGTRMPSGFTGGRSTISTVYDGDPAQQIAAIWTYLSDGSKAGIPDGLIADVIELIPQTTPIIYRNFIDGLSPRGIAVGYPEKTNLAWDASQLSLTLVWHGRFIDASKHWVGRGAGFQTPLGDHVVRLEQTVPIAALASLEAAWPNQPPKERGYQFRGYRLDAHGRPAFRYTGPTFSVVDFPLPVAGKEDGHFERHLKVEAAGDVGQLYFLACAGQIKALESGEYLVDDLVRVRVHAGNATPLLRSSGGRQELLMPVLFEQGKAEIVQEINW